MTVVTLRTITAPGGSSAARARDDRRVRGWTRLAAGIAVVATLLSLSALSALPASAASVIDTIDVGTAPRGVAVTPDGTTAYVTNSFDDTVSVIAVDSRAVLADSSTFPTPEIGTPFTFTVPVSLVGPPRPSPLPAERSRPV